MFIDNLLFTLPFACGLIFALVGFLTRKFPPKSINNLYGYRTPNSMKSQKHWDFAQETASKAMIELGFLLTACSVFGIIYSPRQSVAVAIGITLLVLFVVLLFYRVERAISKKFKDSSS